MHYIYIYVYIYILGFPGGSVVKSPPANVGDTGSICGTGRSPGGGKWLQYSFLESPMDGGTLQATVHTGY